VATWAVESPVPNVTSVHGSAVARSLLPARYLMRVVVGAFVVHRTVPEYVVAKDEMSKVRERNCRAQALPTNW
jgi:hypothetical protein